MRDMKKYRAWRVSNRDKVREYNRAWRVSNPEKKRACHALWIASNLEKYRAGMRRAYRTRRCGHLPDWLVEALEMSYQLKKRLGSEDGRRSGWDTSEEKSL